MNPMVSSFSGYLHVRLSYLCYDGTPRGESLLPEKRMRQNALNGLPLRAYQGKTTCESMVGL